MNIVQSPYFRRSYKRLHANQLTAVNAAIKRVASEPSCGEEKKGDLTGVHVHKFRVQDQLYLLAYEHDVNTLYLLAIGIHENFYRDLKKNK